MKVPPVLVISQGGIAGVAPQPPDNLFAIWFHLEPGLGGAWTEAPLPSLERIRFGYPALRNSRWLHPFPSTPRFPTAAAEAVERLCYLRDIRVVILADPKLGTLALSADRRLRQLRLIHVASIWPPAPADWTASAMKESTASP